MITISNKRLIVLLIFSTSFLFQCYLADDPKFPKIPSTYSTYLSLNDFNGGATYAFKEYYNSKLEMSRFEGTNITVINWKTNTLYWWSSHSNSTDSSCKQNQIPTSGIGLSPSFEAFTKLNQTEIVFKGYQLIDRGINCTWFDSVLSQSKEEIYNSSISLTFQPFNYNLSSIYTFFPTCLEPISTVLDNDTVIISCTTDVIGVIVCAFKVNGNDGPHCQLNSSATYETILTFGNYSNDSLTIGTSLRNLYNVTTTLSYYLTSDTLQPIRVVSNGNIQWKNGTSSPLQVIYDWVDFVGQDSQQPDLYKIPDGCVNDTSATSSWNKPEKSLLPPSDTFGFSLGEFSALFEPIIDNTLSDSIIWRFDASNNYQAIEVDTKLGDEITVFNEGPQGETFSINTYTKKCKSNNVSHPFKANQRNQAVYNVMTGSFTNFTFTNNQTIRRGINVDQWDGQFNIGSYQCNVTVFLFNRGWNFPGRYGVTNKTTIPMAIVVNSQDTLTNTTYMDTWDIFYYVVEDIPNNYINKESLHCLPELPVNYTSLVYVNYGEVGASFSYFETVFSAQKLIYTQGKFSSFYTYSIIDLASQLYSEWLPNATTCKLYKLPVIQQDYFESVSHEPSLDVFYKMAEEFGPVEYIGTTQEQTFNVLQYKTSSPDLILVTRNGIDYQENRTALLNWVPGTGVPHSVHFTISRQEKDKPSTSKSFNIYVYWSMFTSIPSQLQNYTQPGGKACNDTKSNAPNSYSISQSSSSGAFVPPPLSKPDITVPNQFTAYIEVKTKQSDGSYLITPIQWQYSEKNKVETFAIYNPQNYTPSNYKFCYKTQMGGLAKLIVDKKVIGTVDSHTSPLYRIGDGQLVQIFYQPTLISSATLSTTYKMDKGVPGETYTYQTSDNTTSTYMFYPKGWTLFGQNITSRIPLTLYRTSKQGNVSEVWNFYRFTTDIDSDITTGCATTVNEYVGGLSGGIIAAIVIVVSVCFIGITAIVIVVIRKKRQIKQQPPHILLDDRNLINSNEINRVYEN